MAAHLKAEPAPRFVKKKAPSSNQFVSEHFINHSSDTGTFLLKASTVLPNHGIVCIDKTNKNIKLCDFNFSCMAVLKLNTCPFDVCASNKNSSEVYVTEPEREMIHRIKVLKHELKIVQSMDIEEDCRGITCWTSGLAVTVMRPGFVGTFGLLGYDGKVKKKTFETDEHVNLFRAPWYIASTKEGSEVVISDQGNHSVICLQVKSLTVRFVFKCDRLVGPRSLALDSTGFIYVVGSSEGCHNVVVISADGRFVGVMLSRADRLNYPSGLAYNPINSTIHLQRDRDSATISVYAVS